MSTVNCYIGYKSWPVNEEILYVLLDKELAAGNEAPYNDLKEYLGPDDPVGGYPLARTEEETVRLNEAEGYSGGIWDFAYEIVNHLLYNRGIDGYLADGEEIMDELVERWRELGYAS